MKEPTSIAGSRSARLTTEVLFFGCAFVRAVELAVENVWLGAEIYMVFRCEVLYLGKSSVGRCRFEMPLLIELLS